MRHSLTLQLFLAALMLIAKEALLQANGSDDEKDRALFEQKLMVDRLLNQKASLFGNKKIRALKYFLFHYVVFKNPETNRKFIEESNSQSDKNNTSMGIVELMHKMEREEGIEEGRREGVQEGRREGLKKGLETAVLKLLANNEFSIEKIASLMEVPVSLVEKVKAESNKK